MTKTGKSSFKYIKDGDYSSASMTNEYIAYVIAMLSEQDEKMGGCLDCAWERSVELADKFINSKYDVATKGVFECVENFLDSLSI